MKFDWMRMWNLEFYELDNDLDKVVWAYCKLKEKLIICHHLIKKTEKGLPSYNRQVDHLGKLWKHKQEYLKLIKKLTPKKYKICVKYEDDYFEPKTFICNGSWYSVRQVCSIDFENELVYFDMSCDGKDWAKLELNKIYKCEHDMTIGLECYILIQEIEEGDN